MKFLIIYFLSAFLFFSCNESSTTKQPLYLSENQIEDTLIKANKFLLEKDKEIIQSYIERHSWEMKTTESGLWFQIYERTNGKEIKAGDIVKYNYRIELLDGTVCYTSDSTGSEQIKIGRSGKESGLEEGLLKMKVGEKAHFILPPHMAYGLVGDMNRIPHRSTIVYDVEIIKIIEF